MKNRTSLESATRTPKPAVISTLDAKKALTLLISSPSPHEAGNAVKVLTAYFDAVNSLIEAVEALNEKVKGVRP